MRYRVREASFFNRGAVAWQSRIGQLAASIMLDPPLTTNERSLEAMKQAVSVGGNKRLGSRSRDLLRLAKRLARASVSAGQTAPGVLHLRQRMHEARFRKGRPNNGFRGVYANFDEARRSSPAGLIGYDHDRLTKLEISGFRSGDELTFGPMESSEYPLLYWLRPLISQDIKIFDFGGYLGGAFHQFRPYLNYPSTLRWIVCDVPAVVRAGEALARRGRELQLEFTADPADADGTDVLIAAGSLQYLEPGFLQKLLKKLRLPPEHIFVHRTPMHPAAGYVTLQTFNDGNGPVFCPYSVPHEGTFAKDLQRIGYEQVDTWSKPRVLDVPFQPECRLEEYSGMYFRRSG